MVDRRISPNLKRTISVARGSDSTPRKPIVFTEPVAGDDRSTVTDDRTTVDESNEFERDSVIGVVEVDPNKLGDFIANGGASGTDVSGSDTGRKRRSDAGTKRGARGKRKKETSENLDVVINMLHVTAATMLHTPEIILAPEEVEQLSSAYAEFCVYHETPILTPKRMSEVALIAVALKLYGTRFVAIRNRVKEERKERNAQKVVSMKG